MHSHDVPKFIPNGEAMISRDELRKKAERCADNVACGTQIKSLCSGEEDHETAVSNIVLCLLSVQSAQREEDLRAAEEAADELYPEVDPCRNACFAIIDAIRAQGE